MSDEKNSFDFTNFDNLPPKNIFLKKQRSHESSPLSNTELFINDLNESSPKLKKPRSFNSFLSIANRSTNDGSSRNSINSFTSAISNIFGFKSKRTQEQQPPIELPPQNEDDKGRERFASHVAISPDGQFICSFNNSEYLFIIIIIFIFF